MFSLKDFPYSLSNLISHIYLLSLKGSCSGFQSDVCSTLLDLHLPILIISCNIRPVSHVHKEIGGYAVCFSGDRVFLCSIREGFFPDEHSVLADGGVHSVAVGVDGEGQQGSGFIVEIHGGGRGKIHVSFAGGRKIQLSCFCRVVNNLRSAGRRIGAGG